MMLNCGKEFDSRRGSGIVTIVNEAEERSYGDELMLTWMQVNLLTETKNSFHILFNFTMFLALQSQLTSIDNKAFRQLKKKKNQQKNSLCPHCNVYEGIASSFVKFTLEESTEAINTL